MLPLGMHIGISNILPFRLHRDHFLLRPTSLLHFPIRQGALDQAILAAIPTALSQKICGGSGIPWKCPLDLYGR